MTLYDTGFICHSRTGHRFGWVRKQVWENEVRRWHRWASIPAGFLLFFVALTGVLLQLDLIRVGHQPPGHDLPDPRPVPPLPANADLAAIITRAADTIRTRPGFHPRVIELDLVAPGVIVGARAVDHPGTPALRIDGASGRILPDPPAPADFHFILKDLHAGYLFGWSGRVISILVGLALVVLAWTGLTMWWQMRRRGQKGWYWP
jgi:uncharacterized iron-regulated membrane protein